ncbi:Uracil-regulated protein 1 [Colletotrichum spinosum]|uniref:Uracil-regulated protein 1 n=1 Tax=Colletotrichum spinosum TaxID=1347390 RepID=A0A4R8PWF8_9PEZI|nr:Uracil-regulated protein 1 [Colletotrichum spinosum]
MATEHLDGERLAKVLESLQSIQQTQTDLVAAVQNLTQRPQQLPGDGNVNTLAQSPSPNLKWEEPRVIDRQDIAADFGARTPDLSLQAPAVPSSPNQRPGLASRIILTGGSYSIYYALAVASKQLNLEHRPDFTNTEPAANIGPFPQWGDPKKIVAMDPWGHLSPWLFRDIIEGNNVDIRPTIAITKAHMKAELPELEDSVRSGRLVPDGKVCINKFGELAVTKFAVEPVWYLPGVAERFGIDEGALRRSLFEHTGGSYPELITRGDIKVFLPPIVVYNARKRGEDRASDYFKRTENIAGVKDMRFQALMPDILHWLGVRKIDRMLRYFTAGKRMTEDELRAVQGRLWEDIDH